MERFAPTGLKKKAIIDIDRISELARKEKISAAFLPHTALFDRDSQLLLPKVAGCF